MGNQNIVQEIIEMAEADQEMRKNSQNGKRKFDKNIDIQNTRCLKQIIDELGGWPSIDVVGEEAAYAAWLIVQHADHEVEFQEMCLMLMQEKRTQVLPANIAYLTDRVAVNREEPQEYGTQFYSNELGDIIPRPIKDPDGLEKRRSKAGLEPFSVYKQKMKAEYKWPEGYENPRVGRFDKSP